MKLRTKPLKAKITTQDALGTCMPEARDVKVPPHVGGKCEHERSHVRFIIALTKSVHVRDGGGKRYAHYLAKVAKNEKCWLRVKYQPRPGRRRKLSVKVGDWKSTQQQFEAHHFETLKEAQKVAYDICDEKNTSFITSALCEHGWGVAVVKVDLWYEILVRNLLMKEVQDVMAPAEE